jgi:hypothetical protein
LVCKHESLKNVMIQAGKTKWTLRFGHPENRSDDMLRALALEVKMSKSSRVRLVQLTPLKSLLRVFPEYLKPF